MDSVTSVNRIEESKSRAEQHPDRLVNVSAQASSQGVESPCARDDLKPKISPCLGMHVQPMRK
jgi:hypothetical protein